MVSIFHLIISWTSYGMKGEKLPSWIFHCQAEILIMDSGVHGCVWMPLDDFVIFFFLLQVNWVVRDWWVFRCNGIAINYRKSFAASPSTALKLLSEITLTEFLPVLYITNFALFFALSSSSKTKIKTKRTSSAELPIKGQKISQYPAALKVSCRTRHGSSRRILSWETGILWRGWQECRNKNRQQKLLRSLIHITAVESRKMVQNFVGIFLW